MERAYTVAEIDALRKAVETHVVWGSYSLRYLPEGMTSSITMQERVTTTEERVRTYMLAGITAEDLLRDEEERLAKAARGSDDEFVTIKREVME